MNIDNKISKINRLLKLYNKSNTSPTSFYKKVEKRAKHLNKELNFNTLAKDYSNLLKDKKIALQYIIQESKKNTEQNTSKNINNTKKYIYNLNSQIHTKKTQINKLFKDNSGETNSETNSENSVKVKPKVSLLSRLFRGHKESTKKEESTKKKAMINYSSKIINQIDALIKLPTEYRSRIKPECFNKLPNLKKTHKNFIKSINSSKNINEKYSNLKNKTKDFYSKYQLKYSNN
jgi:hypothetical protein